jgi:hypothetical protein
LCSKKVVNDVSCNSFFKKFTCSFRQDAPKDWFAYALHLSIKGEPISTGFVLIKTYILEEFKILAGGANNAHANANKSSNLAILLKEFKVLSECAI